MRKPLNEKGLKTRREVLGDEYVDRALENADDFTWAMQELVTDICWDGIWNRPGLDRKTRSLINIAMLMALGKPHELKAHIIGARNNGASDTEIQEVLLQGAVYCGVPAGVDAFRVAKETKMGTDLFSDAGDNSQDAKK